MAITESKTRLSTSSPNAAGAWPRYVNAAAGAWLFISAFVWAHTGSEVTNAWVVGALMFFAALLALGAPALRFANTVLAVWLFLSTLGLGGATATIWNQIIVAVVAFVVSLIPNQPSAHHPPSAHNPA